jgi:hypothetical protein
MESFRTLGYVVSGGFSQSRGRVHGVGIVSSKQYLSILSESSQNGHFLVVSRQNQRTIGLKVTLHPSPDDELEAKPVIASLTVLQ